MLLFLSISYIRSLIEPVIHAVVFILFLFDVFQWMLPIVDNARTPFKESNISKMVERILKLAVSVYNDCNGESVYSGS